MEGPRESSSSHKGNDPVSSAGDLQMPETPTVKLNLQPLHEEKVDGEVSLSADESVRLEQPASEEQKAREAEALAKVLMLQKEAAREKDFSGLMLPLRYSVPIVLLILFFIFLHIASSLFTSGAGKGILERKGAIEKVDAPRR